MVGWVLLTTAIVFEVVGTVCLRLSEGFHRPVPAAAAIASYGFSLWLLALALVHIPLAVSYAVWSGLGTALIALVGVAVFKESLHLVHFAGLLLIVSGVFVLNVAGASH